MNIAFDTIATNIGMSFENTILIIFLMGSIIFFVRDFKEGLVYLFLLSGAIFMWFYGAGYDYVAPLIVFFLSLIMLSFSLYAVSKAARAGGII